MENVDGVSHGKQEGGKHHQLLIVPLKGLTVPS